ncbi:MAG: hypothetical protein ABSD31_17195 [Candidatus Binataceae bacterium]|jgi:hypothetical protein
MEFKTEFAQLGTPVDIEGLTHLGHQFEVATVEIATPEAAVQVRAHCRLCGLAVQIERATRQPWPWVQWQLVEESAEEHRGFFCHNRRALMLQQYSRFRSLFERKPERVQS